MSHENPSAFNPKLVDRLKGLLIQPRLEWPVIAAEQTSVRTLFQRYAMVLAAIPALSTLLHGLVFDDESPLEAVLDAGVGYGLSLLGVYVLGIVIDGLAQNFGSEKNSVQSMKLAVYAMTPAWVAGSLNLFGLDWLAGLLSLYSLYLLYLGLEPLKLTPPNKTVAYAVVVLLIALLLYLVIAGMVAAVLASVAIVGAGAASFAFD